MRVLMTSAPARAGRVNEDFAGAVPTAAVLTDGAGIPGTEIIRRVRQAEARHAVLPDDATIAHCTGFGEA